MKGLKIRELTGRVVVFRPFGKYIVFSNLELALEVLTRPLNEERQLNMVTTSENDTISLEIEKVA